MVARDAITSVLTQMSIPWPLSAAAREFARAGVPVFPCTPGGKRPLTEHGFHDATTDPGRVERRWRQYPSANIGVPTGAASGVVVVDVDVHGPVNGFAAFDRADRAGLVAGWQLLVNTPSGGMHAYYPATPDTEQPCWQAARAGIDLRGDGGYVVVPPSAVFSNGASVGYRVRTINPGPSTTVDSDALRDFLDPRPVPRPPRDAGVSRRGVDVSRLASWIASRGEGERNRGLYWAACRLAENGVPASDALDVLSAAAGDAGLGAREITATVRSAYRTTRPAERPPSRPQHGSPLAEENWFSRNADTTARSSSPRARGL